ncbi:MAG TPA: GNAT family N-acetyltransferase [Limnochorda sp.]
MKIEFVRLPNVDKRDIIELMNHPLVARHMPLLKVPFTEEDYDAFIARKEQFWAEHGYGPWGFLIDGQFAGWGGLQPEDGNADVAMVLHPSYWGYGKALLKRILEYGFGNLGLESVTIMLPLSRQSDRTLARLGFRFEKQVELDGKPFRRYRLDARRWSR